MGRLKTFAKYALWVILFYVFSNILIFIGLNSIYKSMSSSENVPSQVQINQAETTAVNGRIRGEITNDGEDDLNGKFMKVDLFSAQNTLLGTEFMEISNIEKGAKENFELYFKGQNVDHYGISFVDKIEKMNKDFNVKFLKRPLTGNEVLALLIILMIIG